jgi:Lrp/AsnC family leucine-responsive transcriptional regulator
VSKVKGIPEVAECYNISGDSDYLLKIYAPDMRYYNDFLINTLGTIDSLGSIQSWFVMDEIKNSYGLPESLL